MPLFHQPPSLLILFIAVLLALPSTPHADTLIVATASNFRTTINDIITLFERSTGDHVTPVFGSSGTLAAQIMNGAPFDVFLSADEDRPRQLAEKGFAEEPVPYALGKLVLWAPGMGQEGALGEILNRRMTVAVAEPRLAPYGAAAVAALKHLGRYDDTRLVYARNIVQTFQFVASGNAQSGFVALSQLLDMPDKNHDRQWIVPDSLCPPLRQCAVVVKNSRHKDGAHRFLSVLTSAKGMAAIRRHGYRAPGDLQ